MQTHDNKARKEKKGGNVKKYYFLTPARHLRPVKIEKSKTFEDAITILKNAQDKDIPESFHVYFGNILIKIQQTFEEFENEINNFNPNTGVSFRMTMDGFNFRIVMDDTPEDVKSQDYYFECDRIKKKCKFFPNTKISAVKEKMLDLFPEKFRSTYGKSMDSIGSVLLYYNSDFELEDNIEIQSIGIPANNKNRIIVMKNEKTYKILYPSEATSTFTMKKKTTLLSLKQQIAEYSKNNSVQILKDSVKQDLVVQQIHFMIVDEKGNNLFDREKNTHIIDPCSNDFGLLYYENIPKNAIFKVEIKSLGITGQQPKRSRSASLPSEKFEEDNQFSAMKKIKATVDPTTRPNNNKILPPRSFKNAHIQTRQIPSVLSKETFLTNPKRRYSCEETKKSLFHNNFVFIYCYLSEYKTVTLELTPGTTSIQAKETICNYFAEKGYFFAIDQITIEDYKMKKILDDDDRLLQTSIKEPRYRIHTEFVITFIIVNEFIYDKDNRKKKNITLEKKYDYIPSQFDLQKTLKADLLKKNPEFKNFRFVEKSSSDQNRTRPLSSVHEMNLTGSERYIEIIKKEDNYISAPSKKYGVFFQIAGENEKPFKITDFKLENWIHQIESAVKDYLYTKYNIINPQAFSDITNDSNDNRSIHKRSARSSRKVIIEDPREVKSENIEQMKLIYCGRIMDSGYLLKDYGKSFSEDKPIVIYMSKSVEQTILEIKMRMNGH